MPAQESDLPPVPDDPVDGPGAASTISTAQLPWTAIPKFVPGTTNVQDYVKKLEFLAAMWPTEHLDLLAPRAALLVEGSAFATIAKLDASKLKVKSLDGVKALVKAIGGSWGATDFEERFDFFEKALYGTLQKSDESNDSFISRMEAVFSELLSRGTTLEEVQAYVLLRQSTLAPEDKKRVLLEHKELKYQPVMRAVRRFFHEVQSGKTATKTKVYDSLVVSDEKETVEASYVTMQSAPVDDDDLPAEVLEILISQEDPDALSVQAFENEFEDFIQDTPDMHLAMISYMEARQRLQDKRRARGFWPPGQAKGKGKGKMPFKGKGAGRQNLLAKIARSRCRICNQMGHWKAECPQRDGANAPSPANPPAAAAANVVEMDPHDADDIIDDLEIYTEADLAKQVPVCSESERVQDCFVLIHTPWNNPRNKSKLNKPVGNMMIKMGLNNSASHLPVMHSALAELSKPSQGVKTNPPCLPPARKKSVEVLPNLPVLQASEDTAAHAILDTGASRCIIGSKTLNQLLQRLPESARSTVQQRPSQIKFRFGNNQTLTSMYRVLLPLRGSSHEKVWLGVEVVEGKTPFLFSKRAFKQLGGILDTTRDQCTLTRLQKPIELSTNSTGLYLLDMSEFCAPHFVEGEPQTSVFVGNASHVGVIACSGRETKTPCEKSRFQKRPFSSTHTKPSCSSDPAVSHSSTRVISHHVESRSGHQHAEGDGQYHHGNPDAGSPSVHEHDRSERSGPCRRGAHAPTDQSAASNVPRDVQAESLAPASCREPEQKDAGTSSPIDGYTSPQHEYRAHAQFSNSERRGRRFLSGLTKADSIGYHPECSQDEKESNKGVTDVHQQSSSAQQACLPNADSWRPSPDASDLGRMGPTKGDLGKEASWPHLLPSALRGHGVLRMESAEVQLASSSPTRLCGLLQGSVGSGCRSRSSEGHECSSPTLSLDTNLAQMIQSCQIECSRFQPHRVEQKYQHEIESSLQAAQQIADDVFVTAPKSNVSRCKLVTLEVYAGAHSPLTSCLQDLGVQAYRFTRQDGDLATFSGRQKLWRLIDSIQPDHIFVAPECGPWGGWNRLNAQKSVALWNHVHGRQAQERCHVRLCA